MSRHSPARFVLSVAAEVAAVVFIVSVLPRVDLRTSAGAAPTFSGGPTAANNPPSLLPARTNWPTAIDNRSAAEAYETSYYQRRTPPATSPQSSRDLPPREPTPLIAVDPARPDYVQQRLDRASQDLVNTVGSYVSQAAGDLLQTPSPAPAAPPRTMPQPTLSRLPPIATPPAVSVPNSTAPSGSFPTQPQLQSQQQPRPWVRY